MAFGAQSVVLSLNESVSDTSLTGSPSAVIAVGDLMVIAFATDNTTTTSGASTDHSSVTDDLGNTYTKLFEQTRSSGAVADGVTVSGWMVKPATQIETTTVITFTIGTARTAKAARGFKRSIGAAAQKDDNVAGSGNGTAPSVTSNTLSSIERLWVGFLGFEEGTNVVVTDDADFTSAGKAGSGASGTTNVTCYLASRVATQTVDTFNPTLGAAQDFAVGIVAISEAGLSVSLPLATFAALAGGSLGTSQDLPIVSSAFSVVGVGTATMLPLASFAALAQSLMILAKSRFRKRVNHKRRYSRRM